MFGATRYETASNLPTQRCSAGWEFFQRVDLTSRDTLRYAVDTAVVRRQIESKGWHVWDETPLEERQEEKLKKLTPIEEQPSPVEVQIEATERPKFQWDVPEKIQEPSPLLRSVPTPEVEQPPQPEPQPYARREITLVPEPAPSKVVASKPVEKGAFSQRPPRLEVEKAAPPSRVPKMQAGNQVVWFDIPVRDIDRAIRFYSAVLGAELQKQQAAPGTAIVVLPYGEGSIGGSLVQTMDAKPSDKGPLLYLNTNGRLVDALKEVEQNGGKVLAEMHSIAPFGFRAIVLDSEGNRIALHSM